MDLLNFGVNFFVALFALIDPIGNIPIFATATAGASAAQRRQVSAYIALFIAVFLVFFYVTGLALLEFFGISIAAFRIAGGVLLFLLGLDMTRSDFLTSFSDPDAASEVSDVRGYARRRFERLIVPFAIPLLIGPGAISTVIIQASEAQRFGVAGTAVGLGVILGIGLATLLSFMLTGPISRVLGTVGMAIVVRVLGLVLCAMAVQFIIVGVAEATGDLIASAVARPYAH